jgi:hypothetical protein
MNISLIAAIICSSSSFQLNIQLSFSNVEIKIQGEFRIPSNTRRSEQVLSTSFEVHSVKSTYFIQGD